MKKIVSLILVLCMALSMCAISVAYAGSSYVLYSDLDYSKRLTVGKTATGTISNSDSPYINTEYWEGWAADGYTVRLEEDVEYILIFQCDSMYDSEVNAVFLTGGAFAGSAESFNGDALTDSVGIFSNGCSTYFTPSKTADYRVLCWNWFDDVNGEYAEINYSVCVIPANDTYYEDPEIVLKTPEDVLKLSKMSPMELAFRVIRLNNDIDMTGVSGFRTLQHVYYSDFFGDGNTIKGLTVPFVSTAHYAYFYDLNLEIKLKNYYLHSGIGGFVNASRDCNFYNCSVDVDFEFAKLSGAYFDSFGGIVGLAEENLLIKGCSARVDFKVSGQDLSVTYCGGLVGSIDDSGMILNSYAEFNGEIDCNDASGIGGVFGTAVSYLDCVGTVAVTNIEGSNSSSQFANIGGFGGSADAKGSIDECVAFTNISLPDNSYNIGGFIGFNTQFDFLVCNSYAEGSVTGGEYVSGFIARHCGGVENCYTYGSVKATVGLATGMGCNINSNSYFTLCISNCTVKGGLGASSALLCTNGKADKCVVRPGSLPETLNCETGVVAAGDITSSNIKALKTTMNKYVADNNSLADSNHYTEWELHPEHRYMLTLKNLFVEVVANVPGSSSGEVLFSGYVCFDENIKQNVAEAAFNALPAGMRPVILADIEHIKSGMDISAEAKYLGDINGDDKVNTTDYVMLKRAVLGTYELGAIPAYLADVNEKDGVNTTDYLMLKRVVLGTYTIK